MRGGSVWPGSTRSMLGRGSSVDYLLPELLRTGLPGVRRLGSVAATRKTAKPQGADERPRASCRHQVEISLAVALPPASPYVHSPLRTRSGSQALSTPRCQRCQIPVGFHPPLWPSPPTRREGDKLQYIIDCFKCFQKNQQPRCTGWGSRIPVLRQVSGNMTGCAGK